MYFILGYKKSSLVNVNVLAPDDCRSDVINATKQICHNVLRKKIEPCDINIGNFLESNRDYPDPDLIITFGTCNTVAGFLPWHIRVSEML